MLICKKSTFCSLLLLLASSAQASETSPIDAPKTPSTQETPPAPAEIIEKSFSDRLRETFGATYFTYFYGPGIHPDNTLFNPNQLGNPENDGIYAQNQVSIRYKFSSGLALDFQSRFKVIFNNYNNNPNFTVFRWETPRIGVSGKLLSGKDWSLVGAINTDFPYVFPEPFSGYQAQERTVLFTPGMFAELKYQPAASRWSLFAVVSPRYLFYTNRNVAESQFAKAGYVPQNKAELILAFQPTVSYKITQKVDFTIGTNLDYRKQVISDWNIFNASLLSNGSDPSWRLYAIPINVGITYVISPALTIFPFINTYPIAIQRYDAVSGQQATLIESTGFGMWIRGTLL